MKFKISRVEPSVFKPDDAQNVSSLSERKGKERKRTNFDKQEDNKNSQYLMLLKQLAIGATQD